MRGALRCCVKSGNVFIEHQVDKGTERRVLRILSFMAGLVPAILLGVVQRRKTWMPGTRPGMTEHGFPSERDSDSDQRIVQIIPIRIHRMDESHLPGTWPMLDVLLALDR